jgi:hypothetical protein
MGRALINAWLKRVQSSTESRVESNATNQTCLKKINIEMHCAVDYQRRKNQEETKPWIALV